MITHGNWEYKSIPEVIYMKKRILMLVLALGLTVAAGCGKDDSKKDETQETSVTDNVDTVNDEKEEEEDTRTTAEILAEVDIDKCVVLGDYKNITVEKSVEPVTDEYVQNRIKEDLAAYPVAVTNRSVVQEGDTAHISYVGTIDGVEFEGGSTPEGGVDLRIGSGQYIDGFEDGLIGKRKGETVVLDLTFPEGYSEDKSGKAVQFTVTIDDIKQPLEEPTDEWVAANIEGYYTVDDYEAGIRAEQQEENEQSAENQMRYNSWTQVVDNCTILEYPEPLMEKGRDLYQQQAEYYAALYNTSLEEYVEAAGMTMEEYEENKEEYAKEITAQTLVNYAICQKEGFEIGDEGYQAEIANLLEQNSVATEEELIAQFGQDNVEQSAMLNRVSNLILENATIVEVDNTTENLETEEGDEDASAEEGAKEDAASEEKDGTENK